MRLSTVVFLLPGALLAGLELALASSTDILNFGSHDFSVGSTASGAGGQPPHRGGPPRRKIPPSRAVLPPPRAYEEDDWTVTIHINEDGTEFYSWNRDEPPPVVTNDDQLYNRHYSSERVFWRKMSGGGRVIKPASVWHRRSIWVQARGSVNEPACSNCLLNRGPFVDCRSVPPFVFGSCGNCYWDNHARQCTHDRRRATISEEADADSQEPSPRMSISRSSRASRSRLSQAPAPVQPAARLPVNGDIRQWQGMYVDGVIVPAGYANNAAWARDALRRSEAAADTLRQHVDSLSAGDGGILPSHSAFGSPSLDSSGSDHRGILSVADPPQPTSGSGTWMDGSRSGGFDGDGDESLLPASHPGLPPGESRPGSLNDEGDDPNDPGSSFEGLSDRGSQSFERRAPAHAIPASFPAAPESDSEDITARPRSNVGRDQTDRQRGTPPSDRISNEDQPRRRQHQRLHQRRGKPFAEKADASPE